MAEKFINETKKLIFSMQFLKFVIFISILLFSGFIVWYFQIPLNSLSALQHFVESRGSSSGLILFLINWIVVFYPFLPNNVIHMVAGNIFGFWQALIIVYLSSLWGWSINYYLAKYLGQDFVISFLGKKTFDEISSKINGISDWAFFLIAMIPGLSYDIVAYVAGATNMKIKQFYIGAIGALSTVIVSILIGGYTQGRSDREWLMWLYAGIGMVSSTGITIVAYIKAFDNHELGFIKYHLNLITRHKHRRYYTETIFITIAILLWVILATTITRYTGGNILFEALTLYKLEDNILVMNLITLIEFALIGHISATIWKYRNKITVGNLP